LKDVIERWETVARAHDLYGVVFTGRLEDDTLAVDAAATLARRTTLAGQTAN
jgi:N-methylhydantoinase B